MRTAPSDRACTGPWSRSRVRRPARAQRRRGRMGGDPGQGARPAARDRWAGCRRGGAVNENHEPDRTGPVAWVDGRLMPADAPALPVADRGFQLGAGVFETLRVRRGVAIELDLHLRRLREGLAVLEIRLPWSDAEMAGAIAATVSINAPEDAAVRVTVSRGAPPARGLLPAGWHDLRATLVVQAWPHAGTAATLLERGVRAIVSTARRDPLSPLAGVKTVSRADYVWTRLEADRAGADDAITLTLDGHVAAATTANRALSIGAALRTPPLETGVLAGTTRDWLLAAAPSAARSQS